MSSNNTLLTIHEVSLQALLNQHEANNTVRWKFRGKTKGESTLENGYWLPGGKNNVTLLFWEGVDVKDSVKHIQFTIDEKKNSVLKLNSYDNPRIESFFYALMRQMEGFQQVGAKKVWQKVYPGSFFRRTIEQFILNDKPIIDQLIANRQPPHIGIIDADVFDAELETVLQIRENLGNGTPAAAAAPATAVLEPALAL